MAKKKLDTSWGGVADWYDSYLTQEDSYQQQVILPNLLRVLNIKNTDKILDLACGQGFFAREIAAKGAGVVASDISKELIELAKKVSSSVNYYVSPADTLSFASDGQFDTVVCVLAIQNIEDMLKVFKEVRRVLKSEGRFVLVLNHPVFRNPKHSHWGWDEDTKIQYRRIDSYLSQSRVSIDMHPGVTSSLSLGTSSSAETISYHRSLQDFFKALTASGFRITRLEEWISHKVSEKGPRQKAEDYARREIPLFLMLEAGS